MVSSDTCRGYQMFSPPGSIPAIMITNPLKMKPPLLLLLGALISKDNQLSETVLSICSSLSSACHIAFDSLVTEASLMIKVSVCVHANFPAN